MLRQRMEGMHRSLAILAAAVCAALLVCSFTHMAGAQVTYKYTGNPLVDTTSPGLPWGPSSRIDVLATFNTPPPTDGTATAADALEMTLTNLANSPETVVIDMVNAVSVLANEFTFNLAGIATWDASLVGNFWRDTATDTFEDVLTIHYQDGDFGRLFDSNGPPPAGPTEASNGTPGSFGTEPIPEPGSLLLAGALALLGGVGGVLRRRRKQKATSET